MNGGTLSIRESLLSSARKLPAAPQVLAELAELLQDVNAGLDQISDLLRRDPVLAAQIMRIANGMMFGGGSKVAAIEEAVNRVGFSEIYRLVGLATTGKLVDRALAFYQVSADGLRESILYTALAAEMVAQEAGRDARSAYTAGLMRSIGMMVLDRVARERGTQAEPYDAEKHGTLSSWEGRAFGLANPEVAAIILTEWKFAPAVITAVREHYLVRDPLPGSELACAVNLGAGVAFAAGHGLPGEGPSWAVTQAKLEVGGVDEERLRDIAERVAPQFERLRAALH